MDLQDLTKDSFEPQLNSTFVANTDGGTVELELVEVEELPGNDARSFCLVFRTAPEITLNQGTFVLQHKVLGELAIFMTPIMPDREGRPRYEAVFNRMAP